MLQVIQVDPSAVQELKGTKIDMPAVAYIGIDDGKIVGSCGLAWGSGRCWLWLDLRAGKQSYGLIVAKRAKALLAKARQLGETEVFTPRDAEYSTSEKLLKLLGAQMHGIEEGVEVWKWEL